MLLTKYLKILITVIALSCTGLSQVAADAAMELTFGIVPQQSAQKLAQNWQPVFNEIESLSGLKLIFKTAPNIPIFESRLANSEYDIAYMNPYHYTVFHENPGYNAILKAKDKLIKGMIVVRKDSALTSLESLQGMKIAFPAPGAFAASVVPRAYLAKENIKITPAYVQTHDSVYLTVMKGIYPAGGGILRTFNSMPESVRNELKILWTTPGYTPHAIAVHSRINPDIKNKVTDAFVKLNSTAAGQAALAQLNILAFTLAENTDWDDVRALGIESLTE